MNAIENDDGGDWHQTYLDAGYIRCRPCNEYHRPPECPIDELGRALDPDGQPWDRIQLPDRRVP